MKLHLCIAAMLLLCMQGRLQAQNLLKGKLVDAATHEAIADASVALQLTRQGASTNAYGEFQLAVNMHDTLIISHVNYKTQRIPVTPLNRKPLIIEAEAISNEADEVVVIGYGTTTKRFNTGNVSKITADVIAQQPVTNVLAAMQGRAPGVFVSSQNGLPGGNITVQIRGKNSIQAGNDPLYIIDGVPFLSTPLNQGKSDILFANGNISPLNSINPGDIESIDILKDADATAIYGSRGANGVVLITTKKGSAAGTTVSLDVYEGISNTAHYSDLLSAEQYLAIRREAFANDGTTPEPYNAPDLVKWDTTKSTDWKHYVLGGTAYTTNIQASLSGGSDQTKFLISGNYRHETSVMPGEQYYTRGGFHVNLDHSSSNGRLNVLLTGSYTKDKNVLPQPMNSYIALPPNFPVYNADGSLNWDLYTLNPAAALMQETESKTGMLLSNLSISYKLWQELVIKLSAGYNQMELGQFAKKPAASLNPLYGETNSAVFSNSSSTGFIAEPQLTYTKESGKNYIDAVAGVTWQKTLAEGVLTKGSNYNNETLMESLSAAGHIDYVQNSFTDYRYASFFGRVKYRYADKYLLNVMYRRDGSSRFGPGRQFGNFGAAGAGWIFSEERFIKTNLSFMNYGKLRMSYGITGNDQIPDYQYLSAYGPGISYDGVTTFYPVRTGNPGYGWETTKKLEAALETGLFKNRIEATVSWYRNRSNNQLIQYPLPSQSGFTSYQYNLPALVQNTGWEFELRTVNVRQKAFSWTSYFNITIPRNELVSFPGLSTSSFANTYVTGQSLYVRKGYQFTGIDAATGIPQYLDVNKDGVIRYPDDYVVIGNQVQRYYGGFNNTIAYKGFEFAIFIQFVNQAGIMPATLPGFDFFGNDPADAIQRWQQPGDITNVPVATTTYGSAAWFANSQLPSSSAVFTAASYARIKTVSIAYNLPAAFLNRMKVRYTRLYIEGQNLLTFAAGNRMDPELLTPDGGIPPLRTVAAGIQISF